MSTLGQLYALLANPTESYAESLKTVLSNEREERAGKTDLIKLAEMQRQQESEARIREYYRLHPEEALGLQGGGGMPPGGGPMMQQQVMPGQAPGAPQMVPGGQDLSRYAHVSPQGGGPIPPNVMQQVMPQPIPPQSTLGGPGPQQAQAPQDPLLALMRTDPDAAMAVQGRIQKMQDARLTRTVQETDYVARILQSVKDDAGYGPAREEIRRVLPHYAAQLPPVYSKEAIDALVERAVAVGDRAKNAKLEAETRKLDMETRLFPELAKRFSTEGEAPAPSGDGTGQGPGAPAATTTGTPARTAPPEYESAITEANRLYPQVSPTRIKSIIAAESSYDAKAGSSKGAKGPMGLMDDTAREMGVEDSFNVQQNVRGGTRYYAQLLTKYGGDERKALTAYNWGMGNFAKAGDDITKAPPETKAYVQRVLGGGGGGGTGTAQAPATDPRIAPLEAKIAERVRDSKRWSALGNESLSTRLNDDANRLTAEKNRLIDESRHQQERREEIPRAVARTTAETEEKQRLERQRQAGPMLPEDRRKLMTGLRTDIRAEPTFKLYQDVRNGYQNVRIGAETDSAQGDLAIINGMAKVLDPNSTVMSGEARNVETAQGELERWFNSPQKFFTGDRISTENRPRFLKLAYAMAKEKLATARTELTAVYGPLAKEGNIEMSQLLPLEDLKPIGPGPNVTALDELIKK